ncbi:MAG TPA: AAA family ATPase, partial [Acidimicrobiia bacterium]|nr:AAA family ATPase [Acidimicrobiia bacterium]
EFRTRSYLRCGRHVEVLADIDAWVRLEPGRERMRAHHMVALYRAGRRVDALAVYEDLRRHLADTLGVDPSTFLHDLRSRMIAQDPTLLARRAGIVAALPAWTPSGLPYVGRRREESQIFDRLREVANGGARLVLVEGEAGIGKSRLVLEVARRVHDDAIVLAVDGADALQPGLHLIANALAEASAYLSDAELALCLGRWPGDLAEVVPALRRRLPGLPPALDADDETRVARLRSAVVSWISGLSQRAPVLLLLDDIHRAGPALLGLLGALLVDDEPKRVLVLATARSHATDRSSRLERLARALQQRELLDRIELTGLTSDAVGRLLAELDLPDGAGVVRKLTETTQGHPYLLGELLREPGGDDPASADDVTSRIRQFVLRRVAALGGPCASTVGIAAAIDGEFDIALLADAAHGTAPSTEKLVDRAVEAGLLHVTRLGAFDFVHDLARRAILESIDLDARAVIHRRIALVLEDRGASAASVASQWSRAAGADADLKTRVWAECAGDTALRDLDPHAAAAWFGLAAERAGDEPTRARLLIRQAGAQCQAGGSAGSETLREAVGIARRLDDGDLLVAAATLSTPIWASMPALSRSERIAVLGDASERARDIGVRGQLLARLATELMFTPEWERARRLADGALTDARAGTDDRVLSEVLLRHFQATGTPHNLAERRRNAKEAVAISAAGHDPVQQFFALSTAASAAIEAARLDEADGYAEAALALGRESELPVLTYNSACIRAWRTGLAGDLVAAEEIALHATEIGTRHGIEHAALGPSLQIGWIRWQQGRFGELLPIFRATLGDDPGSAVLLARALASFADSRGEALEVLTAAARNGFEDLPLGLLWSGTLVAAAEAASMLGAVDVGRVIRRLLEPFTEQTSFNGSWVIVPLAYGAALAAAAAGDDDVNELFECALAVSDRLRAPLLRARTEIVWTRVLGARAAVTPY